MIRTFVSAPASPFERGREFGAEFAVDIQRTAGHYTDLMSEIAGRAVDLAEYGPDALEAIAAFSLDAADEIRGIAEGAGEDVLRIAALNARTEVLALLGARFRGECSTVVKLDANGERPPISVQTWDWVDIFADDWLFWTIQHPGGTVVHTITEFGVLGKIGVNNRGVGVHFNLLHHDTDGAGIGVPIHVLARSVLDQSAHIGQALDLVGKAVLSASSALTLIGADVDGSSAISAELSPIGPRFVQPDDDGLLIHTNHFLDPVLAAGDLEPRIGPDTWLRHSTLRRRLARRLNLTVADVTEAMSSHHGGGGAVCCHPERGASLPGRWQTLATVSLDVQSGTLAFHEGGPCRLGAASDHSKEHTSNTIGALL